MQFKKLRNLVFPLHRYIGLAVGLLLIVVGLTGSLLVLQEEINHFLLSLQIGHIVPQENRISLESALDTVKAAHASRPDFTLSSITPPSQPDTPYTQGLTSRAEDRKFSTS